MDSRKSQQQKDPDFRLPHPWIDAAAIGCWACSQIKQLSLDPRRPRHIAAKQWRKESIEEMQHGDKLVERIIFLEDFPNMQVLDPLPIGQNVKEVALGGSLPRRADTHSNPHHLLACH